MEKKVVLITGSSRGIGASTALKFATEGYNVVINYKENLVSANQVKEETLKYGSDTLVIKADLANETEINQMVVEIVKNYGHIDV